MLLWLPSELIYIKHRLTNHSLVFCINLNFIFSQFLSLVFCINQNFIFNQFLIFSPFCALKQSQSLDEILQTIVNQNTKSWILLNEVYLAAYQVITWKVMLVHWQILVLIFGMRHVVCIARHATWLTAPHILLLVQTPALVRGCKLYSSSRTIQQEKSFWKTLVVQGHTGPRRTGAPNGTLLQVGGMFQMAPQTSGPMQPWDEQHISSFFLLIGSLSITETQT